MGGDQEDRPRRPSRTPIALDLQFKDLSPATAGDLFDFFAGPAFADFPDWRGCNCLYYNISASGREWTGRSAEQNRADKLALIEAGKTNGVLAYSQGTVAGWCHADRRSHLVRLDQWDAHPEPESTGIVICFVVHPELRGRGVAAALLDAATERLRRLGLAAVEAYPSTDADLSPKLPAAQALYHGPLSLYRSHGFEEVPGRGELAPIVRKALR